jgi:uncharacterized Tic20 family protein
MPLDDRTTALGPEVVNGALVVGWSDTRWRSEVENEAKQAVTSRDERLWATLCHLSALAGLVVPLAGNVVGPLVVWLIKREDSPLIDDQGKEALNFQISMTLYMIAAGILVLVVVGIFLLFALAVMDLIFIIIASIRANYGERYRYPLTIRLVK